MRIGPTTLHNFGPFAHVEFDLSQPGLTGIEGVMHDRPGCTSNGSGKSYLLGGVAWVLFDDPMRDKYGKDDLIRLLFTHTGGGGLEVVMNPRGTKPQRPEGGCWGRVFIVNGEKDIRVERYRGHPTDGNRVKLFIDGTDVTRGRDSMTNLAIEEALGMDFRAFMASVAFGAREDVKSFFSATDTERKQILDKLLGMEVYAEAQKIARARLKSVSIELEEAERAQRSLTERIEEQERILSELAGAEELAELEFDWRRQRALVQLAVWEEERLGAYTDEAREELAEVETAAEERLATHRDALEDVRAQRRKLESKRQACSKEFGEFGGEAKAAARDIARWEELGGKTCASCEQTVSRQAAIQAQRRAIKRRDDAVEAGKEVSVQIDELVEQISQLEEPEAPVIPELEEAKAEVRERDSVRREWTTYLRELRTDERAIKKAYDKARGQSDQLAGRIKEMREELRTMIEETYVELQTTADQLEFWVEGFGPGGLRSFLIEAEVPEINVTATRYAQRLLGPGTVVQISATKTLATGDSREELTVAATIPGCTRSYAGASKGQRKRLDLALLLAFREIVGRRSAKNFDQLFADELFDGLDEAGEEAVVELLRELAAECPVTLVTHSDVLKSAANRLLVLHHRDGIAELEQVG